MGHYVGGLFAGGRHFQHFPLQPQQGIGPFPFGNILPGIDQVTRQLLTVTHRFYRPANMHRLTAGTAHATGKGPGFIMLPATIRQMLEAVETQQHFQRLAAYFLFTDAGLQLAAAVDVDDASMGVGHHHQRTDGLEYRIDKLFFFGQYLVHLAQRLLFIAQMSLAPHRIGGVLQLHQGQAFTVIQRA